MDRIKVSINIFIGPEILKDGWKRIYKGKNRFQNLWTKKTGGILFIYYPNSKILIIDFSAPELICGHNLYDYRVEDNQILFSMLNSAVVGIVPARFPSAENWNVSYIEFTKNYVYPHDEKVDKNLHRIKKIRSLPYLKNFKLYETGIIIWNGSRVLRAYEKKAEILHKKQSKKSEAWINFKQLRIEAAYRNKNAIRQRFKTNKLGDLLQQHVLTKEINELNEKFELPAIEDRNFSRTNNRQKNLIAYQNGTYILRQILISQCSVAGFLVILRAILFNGRLNAFLQNSWSSKFLCSHYWVSHQDIQSKSGWT